MKKEMKKEKGSDEARKNSRKSHSVLIAGIIVSAVLLAFMPLATAVVTNFVVTPANNLAGATSDYTIQVNTTNFTALNISIPKGFKAETPSAGDLIARADLWWNTPSPGTHYGYVNFTANATAPLTKVDVVADIGGGTATLYDMNVNYTEGGTTSIKSPFGTTHQERANLTLPTDTAGGYLNITGLPDNITNVTVSISKYVKNPSAGDYEFVADGEPGTVHIAPPPPVPVPEFNIFGLLALVAILIAVLAVTTLRKEG